MAWRQLWGEGWEAALGRHWGGLRRQLQRSRQRAGRRAAAQEEKQGGNEEGGRGADCEQA